jgi:isoleucyl-tRNA synthetase
MRYEPLFTYFADTASAPGYWRVVSDPYVSDADGTGIVHQAPAFGEDDFRVCQKHGIIGVGGVGVPCPVDDSGRFTAEVSNSCIG